MNIEQRREIVEQLLASAKNRSADEIAVILNADNPTVDFIHEHIRKYVLAKYLLGEDCEEDNIYRLATLSLARMMKLEEHAIRSLDTATPCDHATSESTKKVLLLFSVQRDLKLRENPEVLAQVNTVSALAEYIYNNMNGN